MLFMLFGHDLPLFCTDFLSIMPCSVYESVGEVLEFTIAAPHKIDVVANRKLHKGLPPMEIDV